MGIGVFGVGVTEAETLQLSGFVVDQFAAGSGASGDAWIRSEQTKWATASGSFTGTAGSYDLDIAWQNQSDGEGYYELRINGGVVDSWRGTGGDDSFEIRRITASLSEGDTIELAAKKRGGESPRIDTVTISTAGSTPDPDTGGDTGGDSGGTGGDSGGDTGGGGGSPSPTSGVFGVGVTEAETLQLSGFVVDQFAAGSGASGDAWIRSEQTKWATASGSFTGTAGSYDLDIAWQNQSDGEGYYELRINGGVVDSWRGTGGDDSFEIRRITASLSEGDTIELAAKKRGGESPRIDTVTISTAGSTPDPDTGGDTGGDSGGTGGDSGGDTGGGGGSPSPTSGIFGVGVTEAETLQLSGFVVDQFAAGSGASGDAWIRSEQTKWATASGSFTGTAGSYDLDIAWQNQSDGEGYYELRINGGVVDSWRGTGGDDSFEIRRITASLSEGDTIELAAKKRGGESPRIDTVTISTAGSTPDPDTGGDTGGDSGGTGGDSGGDTGGGGGSPSPTSGVFGVGVTEAETLQLSGFVVDQFAAGSGASGDAWIRSEQTKWATASGSFTGTAGSYDLDIAWQNQSDGEGYYELRINGGVVDSWRGTGGDDSFEIRRITASLSEGDTIELAAKKRGGESPRIDTVTISTAGSTPDPDTGGDTGGDSGGTGGDSGGDTGGGGGSPSPTSGVFGVGVTEAETLQLSGFVVDQFAAGSGASGDAWIRSELTKWATASGSFTGTAGSYDLDIAWQNQSDGEGYYELRINGGVVDSWRGFGGSGAMETRSVTLNLVNGDTIELAAKKHGGESPRIDNVTISNEGTNTGSDPAPDPVTDAFDFFAFAGQSNAERHFFRASNDSTAGPLGYEAFEAKILELSGAVETTAIEAAKGGSSSNNLTPSSYGYWWNLITDAPGQNLLDAVSTIRAHMPSGRDLDGIIWAQGEHDATYYAPLSLAEAEANLKTATIKIFDYFRDQFGDVPIFIQELGDFEPSQGMAAMRAAQAELVAELDYVYLGAGTFDEAYDHYDYIHFSVDGYNDIADVLAQSAFEVIGADEFQFA